MGHLTPEDRERQRKLGEFINRHVESATRQQIAFMERAIMRPGNSENEKLGKPGLTARIGSVAYPPEHQL
jgi:hypothetical protein